MKRILKILNSEKSIVLVFVVCIAIGLLSLLVIQEKQDTVPVKIKMKVELINNCHVLDDAFMVMLQPSGRTAFFKEKVAEIYVSSKDQVRLAASSKFPGFAYDGDFVDVATNVKLIADCESPDRIERTLDALKDQFKR